jgi:hypothetical protein
LGELIGLYQFRTRNIRKEETCCGHFGLVFQFLGFTFYRLFCISHHQACIYRLRTALLMMTTKAAIEKEVFWAHMHSLVKGLKDCMLESILDESILTFSDHQVLLPWLHCATH